MTADEPTDEFDPDLPILWEIEHELERRMAAAVEAGEGSGSWLAGRSISRGERTSSPSYRPSSTRAGAVPPPRPASSDDTTQVTTLPPRRRRASASRRALRRTGVVARRSGALVGLGLLVGATALATRSFVSSAGDGDPSLRTTDPAQIGSGHVNGEAWTLSASRRGDDLCDAFFVDGLVSTRCDAPPAAGETLVDDLVSPSSHYVLGLTAANVRAVSVQIGMSSRTTSTRPVSHAPAIDRARLPRGLRWFVVRVPRDASTPGRRDVRVNSHVR
ncbi:hypothetical protein Q5424_17220 [Conexibacter sp. JD483]|uniref:hypothetical protein n=1 Tax=unclassified Conexibacter TaxID=2627773 RepID=UPI0027162C86|nr:MULTISPECIES: hypothetical protein [unclassified Conexibacter]MDO8188668.1 hypothetical protein [Conexibacter sp. CPCC 205706]MDO8199359.1 hypothetical protein [Conexibacter sp. CPCC 205762]MDR9370841.1 hypothetical protein [Conexibacter sp. JD483]